MRFIKEITLFAPSGTLKRFQGLETSFKVEQGKISALISESELTELRNSDKTMYGRLYSAEQTVSGLDKLYTDISGKYDAVSGQYTDLDTKVAEYKESVDGFSANLTKLSEHVRDDYSTTQAMEAYVKASIEGFESTVSQTYVTTDTYTGGINDAKKYAGTQASGALNSAKIYADDAASGALESAQSDATAKANAALKDAKADVTERLKSYSTTAQMNSAITQKAQEITLSVSQTYVTTETYGNGIEDAKKYAGTQASGALNSAKIYADDAASGALESAQSDATAKANAALKDAKADVTERLKSYSTTEQMKAAINTTADQIVLEVSEASYYNYCTNSNFDSETFGWEHGSNKDPKDTYLDVACASLLYYSGNSISTALNSTNFISWKYSVEKKQKNKIVLKLASKNPGNVNIYLDDTVILSISKNDITAEWKEFSVDTTVEAGEHTLKIQVEEKNKYIYITAARIFVELNQWTESKISVLSDEISSKVEKDGIVSAINQTAETIKISAAKINFNGLVTANNYFKINTDGSMEAKAGKIAGWKITSYGFEKDGMEIHNTGSISDSNDFTSDDITRIYPDGITTKKIKGELIYNSTEYGGYTGTLKVMTGTNTYKNLTIRNGCIVVKHV